MKTKLVETLKSFDVVNGDHITKSFYLDKLSNGKYLISRDENPLSTHDNLRSANTRFYYFANKYNAEIEIAK